MGPALRFLTPEGVGEPQQVANPVQMGLILATNVFHGFCVAESTAVCLTVRHSLGAWAYGEELGFRTASSKGP